MGSGIIKPSIWQAWAAGLGTFIYPCYLQNGKAFAKKPFLSNMNKEYRSPVIGDSPFLIYSVNGNEKTPSGVTMPKNALFKMLSKEMVKSIEAVRSAKDIYPATCDITAKVEKIFYRSESVKEKNQIVKDFDRMNLFVLATRERIEEYVSWQERMRKMLEEQARIEPQFKQATDELEKELVQIPQAYAKVKDRIKTPQYCKELTEKTIALIDSTLSDEDKEEQCKQLGREIRIIGGGQDSLLGIYRIIVKACRQYTTVKLMTSSNAAEIELLKNFRHETGLLLNDRLVMEGR